MGHVVIARDPGGQLVAIFVHTPMEAGLLADEVGEQPGWSVLMPPIFTVSRTQVREEWTGQFDPHGRAKAS